MSGPRRTVVLVTLCVLAGCAGTSAVRTQSTPTPLPSADSTRLAQCQILANRAQIRTPMLTQDTVFELSDQTLRDHGVLPPSKIRGVYQVHRVTQADIQAAADELKVCFPPA